MVLDSKGRDLNEILERARASAAEKRAKYRPNTSERTQRHSELLSKQAIALDWLSQDANKVSPTKYAEGLKRYEAIEEELKTYEKSTKPLIDEAIDLFSPVELSPKKGKQ